MQIYLLQKIEIFREKSNSLPSVGASICGKNRARPDSQRQTLKLMPTHVKGNEVIIKIQFFISSYSHKKKRNIIKWSKIMLKWRHGRQILILKIMINVEDLKSRQFNRLSKAKIGNRIWILK